MSQCELEEWVEYLRLEPTSADRFEIMIAKSMALSINKYQQDESKHCYFTDFMVSDVKTEKKRSKNLAEQAIEAMQKVQG